MTALIIFDSSVSIKEKNIKAYLKTGDNVILFPLTSDTMISATLLKTVRGIGCRAGMLDSACLVNSSAEKLRGKYLKFIAELPESCLRNEKNIKEIFAIDSNTSLWWFSVVAGKNTFTSDAFNRIAQFDAITGVIKDNSAEIILYGLKNNTLKKPLFEYLKAKAIRARLIPIARSRSLMDRILPSGAAIFFKNIYLLLRSATGFFIRMLKTKNMTKKLGGLKRTEISKDHIMLMTYHPVFDMTLADQGIFKNSHYTSLQESLESNNQKLVWIALYLKHPLISHNRMLEYTEKFIKNDYPIYLLDEFCSVKSYLLAFLRIISSGLKFLFYEKAIAKAHDLGEYNIYSFLRNDWYSSFCGSAGYSTILYYEMFKSLFMSAGSKKCFFPSEMQSWEKALISARDYLKKDLYLIAHQSGTIARMLLICFNYPTEFRRDCAYPMPLPEKMACNGRVTYSYMKESGWPEDNLGIVEAIRYDYLKQHLGLKWDKKRKVVLILFSISAHESSAILNMAYHALRELEGIEVWLRPHPFLRIEDVLRNSSFDREEIPFKFKNGPIAESFREARIVIGGESGTCVEALAFGCKVIIVNSPEWINMSPLAQEKSDVIKKVSSVGELRKVVKETVSEKYEPEYVKPEPLRIINDFFYLDPASNIPSRILGLLKGER